MSKPISRELAQKAIEKIQQAVEYYEKLEILAKEHQEKLQEKYYSERNAKPCPYCDIDGEYPDLVTAELDMGEIGKLSVGTTLYPTENTDKYRSNMAIYIELDTGSAKDVLCEKKFDINYCPVCGRKL